MLETWLDPDTMHLFNAAVSSWLYSVGWWTINELERIWKEAAVAWFKILTCHLSGDWGKPRNTLVRIAELWVEIWTRDLPKDMESYYLEPYTYRFSIKKILMNLYCLLCSSANVAPWFNTSELSFYRDWVPYELACARFPTRALLQQVRYTRSATNPSPFCGQDYNSTPTSPIRVQSVTTLHCSKHSLYEGLRYEISLIVRTENGSFEIFRTKPNMFYRKRKHVTSSSVSQCNQGSTRATSRTVDFAVHLVTISTSVPWNYWRHGKRRGQEKPNFPVFLYRTYFC
jgi:hypothetical protein